MVHGRLLYVRVFPHKGIYNFLGYRLDFKKSMKALNIIQNNENKNVTDKPQLQHIPSIEYVTLKKMSIIRIKTFLNLVFCLSTRVNNSMAGSQ